jgi:mono/diheme cytochrome c family protein
VSRTTGWAVVIGAAGVALAALALGCGGEPRPADPATLEAGARVFREAGCGTCHALSAAGSVGRIGPSLDRRRLGATAVAAQVRDGGGGMPAFDGRLSEDQIDALATYVAEVGGR